MRNRPIGVMFLVLTVLSVAACTGAEPTSTPTTAPTPTTAATPTPPPSPTAAAASPTAAPSPTAADAPSDARAAGEGDSVAVHYTGTLDSGEEFDSSRGGEPLSFVVGDGRMISGFDAAVRGMAVGDSRTVRLEPADAYGESREDLIFTLPIEQLPEGLGAGDSVYFTNGGQGVILDVTGESFRVDANHRLAGQALTFEITMVSIE